MEKLEKIIKERTIRYIKRQIKELSETEILSYFSHIEAYTTKYKNTLKIKRWAKYGKQW